MQPSKNDFTVDMKDRSLYVQDKYFSSQNGKQLHGWLMGAKNQKPKAVILQFHGNAQNITTHAFGMAWWTQHNFQVLAFDYQGYGKSEGVATVVNALEDCVSAIHMATEYAKSLNVPLILYGQSLGGSLLLKTLKDHPQKWTPQLVVIESSFYSYPMIAREKLANFIITWPLQWMSYVLIPSTYNPGGEDLKTLSHLSFLFLYSEEDPIVPIYHGRLLFEDITAKEKEFWSYPEAGHIAYSYVNGGNNRIKLLNHILRQVK